VLRKIIGIIIVSSPLWGMFIWLIKTEGWKKALSTFGGAILVICIATLVIGFIWLGLCMIFGF
jgi:hypothetical protein